MSQLWAVLNAALPSPIHPGPITAQSTVQGGQTQK